MGTENLKKELHILIDNINDEGALNMVKEDLVAYQTEGKEIDDLDDLSDEDRSELEQQDKEDPMKDTITEKEFNQHIQEWRTKLSTKNDF